MIPPIDLSKLSPPAQKIAGAGAPPKMQEMAAKGIAPGVRPADLLAVLVLLSESALDNVREAARATLAKLPEAVLNGALGAELQPAAIHAIAIVHIERV